jgi:hypothetical protein
MVTRVNFLLSVLASLVLSPPCGMVTEELHIAFSTISPQKSSKPTVWDGDLSGKELIFSSVARSKPTVWDGDATPYEFYFWLKTGSKPTVWDGDKITYSYPVPASQKGFLMCRVELKDLHLRVLPSVPNAPCGVERLTRCFFL